MAQRKIKSFSFVFSILISFFFTTVSFAQSGIWQWTSNRIVDIVSVRNVVISPDGEKIVFSKTRWGTETNKPIRAYTDLWMVSSSGKDAKRLTTADAGHFNPKWSPDGSHIAFLSNRGTSKKTQIWNLPISGGEAKALTDKDINIASFQWAPDGKSIAYLAVDPVPKKTLEEQKTGKDAIVVDQNLRPRRLWILDIASETTKPVDSLQELSAWDFDWAPDGKSLVATITDKNRTDDSYVSKRIAVLPLRGKRRKLVSVVGKIGPIQWAPDGKSIAWLGGIDSSDPSFGSLFIIPQEGGTPKNLTGKREETARSFSWRPDGKIALVNTVGTQTTMIFLDPATNDRKTIIVPGVSIFSSISWSQDGLQYAFSGETSKNPSDVYAGALPQPKKPKRGLFRRRRKAKTPPIEAPKQIVNSNPQLASLPITKQETIRYQAKDGLSVEGVLIYPKGFSPTTRYPLVVVVHGGPESQYLDGWLTSYSRPGQAFAERGYMVFFPNYRGSTGRGVSYAKADHKDLGGKEFTDVLDGIDYLVAKGWVDTKQVGITGGSYGGYFTALGVTKYSDRFAVGVELFGVTNWLSFLGQSDIPKENSMVHWALWCYDNLEICQERSPVGHITKANTPTLILQGELDARVPKAQSDELYAGLRWKQVPVEYVVYPREGHGFQERWHQLDTSKRMMQWMSKYLKAPE